ncbi:MAG: hypothetical protein IPO92_12710 [Saprospiraceae bacterium]|nr:hypothetical protein [Saprospiraceae bacterium]
MIQNSDMFKKIKSLFIHEDPAAEGAQVNNEASVESKGENNTLNQGTYQNRPVGSGSPDPKFTELLLKAIESNNQDGFDYLEYKNSIKSIENVIPDEGMRYKSAFEMAKTMGLTKEKLVQSAKHYLQVLSSEDQKFKEALENQKAKQIQGRADQIQSFEKSITEKQQMIEKFSQEIESAKKQLETFKGEINEAIVKIDMTNQQFVSSYNLVYGQVSADVEKINQNL